MAQIGLEMDTPITVRTMIREDSDFAGKMTVEAFEGKMAWAAGRHNLPHVIAGQQRAHQQMEDKYNRIFVALYEGQRAGLVALKFHGQKEFGDGVDQSMPGVGCCGLFKLWWFDQAIGGQSVPTGFCYIDHICVDSKFRGKGIGKALMERADAEARQKGCNSMYLWVARDNRARHLYERQGYQVTEEEDGCLITYIPCGVRYWCKMVKQL